MQQIGQRLKEIRQSKNMSQGDVEKKTHLLRCYSSRVECGHTIPSLETLKKYAEAFGIEVYQFFYEGNGKPDFLAGKPTEKLQPKDKRFLQVLVGMLPRIEERDRKLLLGTARQMSH